MHQGCCSQEREGRNTRPDVLPSRAFEPSASPTGDGLRHECQFAVMRLQLGSAAQSASEATRRPEERSAGRERRLLRRRQRRAARLRSRLGARAEHALGLLDQPQRVAGAIVLRALRLRRRRHLAEILYSQHDGTRAAAPYRRRHDCLCVFITSFAAHHRSGRQSVHSSR